MILSPQFPLLGSFYMADKKDIYKDKPWKSLDQYFELASKHQLWGDDLAVYLKKQRSRIPIPKIKILTKLASGVNN